MSGAAEIVCVVCSQSQAQTEFELYNSGNRGRTCRRCAAARRRKHHARERETEAGRRKQLLDRREARKRKALKEGREFEPRLWLRRDLSEQEMRILFCLRLIVLARWHERRRRGLARYMEYMQSLKASMEWQTKFLSESERELPNKVKRRLRYRRDEEYRLKILTKRQAAHKANPSTLRARAHKRRAILRKQHDGTVAAKVIRELIKKRGACLYCGVRVNQSTAVIDHMDPVSRGGLYSKKNIAVACYECNAYKRNKPFDEWVELLDQPFKDRAMRYYKRTTGREVGQCYLTLKFIA